MKTKSSRDEREREIAALVEACWDYQETPEERREQMLKFAWGNNLECDPSDTFEKFRARNELDTNTLIDQVRAADQKKR